MEKKGKQIILNCEKLERRFALLNNGRLEEYQIERDDHEPKVGDIYLGRIINLEPSLQAAFVDIGAEKNAFLHYHEMLPGCGEMLERRGEQDSDSDEEEPGEESIQARRRKRQEARPGSKVGAEAQRRKKKLTVADIPAIFRPGMEILVQVVKSPISTKGARVTTDISIPGRYLVLMPYSEHIGLSTRIEGAQERDRLRKILAALELPEGMGLICRTVGAPFHLLQARSRAAARLLAQGGKGDGFAQRPGPAVHRTQSRRTDDPRLHDRGDRRDRGR